MVKFYQVILKVINKSNSLSQNPQAAIKQAKASLKAPFAINRNLAKPRPSAPCAKATKQKLAKNSLRTTSTIAIKRKLAKPRLLATCDTVINRKQTKNSLQAPFAINRNLAKPRPSAPCATVINRKQTKNFLHSFGVFIIKSKVEKVSLPAPSATAAKQKLGKAALQELIAIKHKLAKNSLQALFAMKRNQVKAFPPASRVEATKRKLGKNSLQATSAAAIKRKLAKSFLPAFHTITIKQKLAKNSLQAPFPINRNLAKARPSATCATVINRKQTKNFLQAPFAINRNLAKTRSSALCATAINGKQAKTSLQAPLPTNHNLAKALPHAPRAKGAKKYLGLFLIALLAIFFAACSKSEKITFSAMNTKMSLSINAPNARRAAKRAVSSVKTLEASILAIYDDENADALKALRASVPLATLTDTMLAVERDTGGAFNPFLRPLSKLWGFGHGAPDNFKVPSKAQIENTLSQINAKKTLFEKAWEKESGNKLFAPALGAENSEGLTNPALAAENSEGRDTLSLGYKKTDEPDAPTEKSSEPNTSSEKTSEPNNSLPNKKAGEAATPSDYKNAIEPNAPTEKSGELKKPSLDAENSRALNGLPLDFGGAAKGFAGDKIIEVLKSEKAYSALIDLGGNIAVFGQKGDGSDWTLGVRDPFKSGVYCLIKIKGKNGEATHIVTSGGYERFHTDGKTGRRYCHILNGKTGRPAESDIESVTTIGTNGALCDALATAFFVMGSKKTKEFYEGKKYNIEYLIIKKDGKILSSPNVDWRK